MTPLERAARALDPENHEIADRLERFRDMFGQLPEDREPYDGAIAELRAPSIRFARAVIASLRDCGEEALIASLKARYPSNLYAWERLPEQRRLELLAEARVPHEALIDRVLEG